MVRSIFISPGVIGMDFWLTFCIAGDEPGTLVVESMDMIIVFFIGNSGMRRVDEGKLRRMDFVAESAGFNNPTFAGKEFGNED